MEKSFEPKKRNNLTELSDHVHHAKAAMKMRMNIEETMTRNEKLILELKKTTPIMRFSSLLLPNYMRIVVLRRELEATALITKNDVLLKQHNIYQLNELKYHDFLKDVTDDMHERYDEYWSRLNFISKNADPEEVPMLDVNKLIDSFNSAPPETELDRIAFYLSMESTLSRC